MRLLFHIFSCLLIVFLASVLYMCIFLHMSFNQAVNRIFYTIKHTVSSVEVPEHLSHTPSQAADAQLERVAKQM